MANIALEEGLHALEAEITRYESMASHIKEALEYADGQAYYEDKRRMEEALRKAYVLGRIREIAKDYINGMNAKVPFNGSQK